MINDLVLLFVAIVGVVATYIVSVRFKLGPVVASAGLSLLVALFIKLIAAVFAIEHTLILDIPVIFIGASFAGMSSESILKNEFFAGCTGMIFYLIFFAKSSVFAGMGGGLGTIACLSVLSTYGILHLLKFAHSRVDKVSLSNLNTN
jgi:hypothetical protein